MKHFTIVALIGGTEIEKFEICAASAKSAKQSIEQHWRENLVYDAQVAKVLPSTYEQWAQYVWGDQE